MSVRPPVTLTRPPRVVRRPTRPIGAAKTARDAAARDLRRAVVVTFALSGFLLASWAVRVPDVLTRTGATASQMGLALLCISLGGLAAMRPTGRLCERYGAGRVTVAAAVLLAATVVAPGYAASVGVLAVALTLMGAAAGVLNVAMNSLGVRLEALLRRPVLPSLHAAFSLGGLAAGLLGGLAATLVAPGPHLLVVGLVGVLVTGWLWRPLTTSDRGRETPAVRPRRAAAYRLRLRRPRSATASARTVVLLGLIAGCTALGESAVTDWGAAHLRLDLGATALEAALGYSLFCVAMAAGRLAGHHLVTLLGETRVLVGGALAAAGGLVLAATTPVLGVAWAGFALAGLGLANSFPLAIARAGALGGPRAVSTAATVGYGGLLLGPPVIGLLADRLGLGAALGLLAVTSVAAGVLAFVLRADARPAPVGLYWAQARVASGLDAGLGGGLRRTRLGFAAAADRQMAALSLLDPRYLG